MVTFLYRCPTTGCHLEARWAPPAPSAASPLVTYVAETCPACGGLHIVNPANGRMMSNDRRPSVSTGSRLTRGAPRPDLWA